MIKKYQKKNGTTAYMFKAYLGIDPTTGKKRYTTKRGFKTQREAKQAYNRLQVQVQENDVLTDSNRLFSELAEEWLEQYKKHCEGKYLCRTTSGIKQTYPPTFWEVENFKDHDSLLSEASQSLVLLLQKVFKSDWLDLFDFQIRS